MVTERRGVSNWIVNSRHPVYTAVPRRHIMTEAQFPKNAGVQANLDFVVDGFDRAWNAVEAEIKHEVEEKYAQEWNSSGIIKRWRLQRLMEHEIAERVSERLKHISDDSMF